MAKSTNKKKYFQLGEKALSFADAQSGLIIRSPEETVEISAKRLSNNSHVREALTHGHIKEVESPSGEVTHLPLKEVIKGEKVKTNKEQKDEADALDDMEEEMETKNKQRAEDAEKLSKSELIDNIKASNVDDEVKKGLAKKSPEELQAIWDDINKGK